MAPEGTVILLCITGAPAPCLPFLPSAAKQLPASELPRGGDGEYTTFHTHLSTPKTSFFRVFAENMKKNRFFLKDVFQGRLRDSVFYRLFFSDKSTISADRPRLFPNPNKERKGLIRTRKVFFGFPLLFPHLRKLREG